MSNHCLEFGCENAVEGNTDYCATHNFEHRRAERNAKKVKIVKPVKKVTEKKAKELIRYSKLRADFLEHKMVCEFRFEGCLISASDIHHAAGRIGDNFLDTKTWRSICRNCHDYGHTKLSSEDAIRLGFKIGIL